MKAGWQTKKLGEISSIELGKTPSRSDKSLWDEKRVSNNVWLSIADLLNTNGNVVCDSKEYVSDKGAALSKTVLKGTLLVSFKLTLGRLAFAGRNLFTNEAIAALGIFNEKEISKEFLYYFLHHFDWVKAAENDAKIKGMTLNKAKLKELAVFYPSIHEQQRIVAILDQAFEGIAKTRANAEQNLQNARALFESHLQSVFTQRGMGWVEMRLGDVCKLENGDRGVNYPSKSIQTNSGIPFINAGHLTDDGLDFETMNYIPKERFDLLGAGKIKAGDILFCLRGSLGKCTSVGNLAEGAIASSLVIIRAKEIVRAEFLLAYLRSHLCAQMIAKYSNGAAQPNLSAQSLKQFLISIPSPDKQEEIVRELNKLKIETQRLEALYQRKIELLDELKKSLLQQAFSGEL